MAKTRARGQDPPAASMTMRESPAATSDEEEILETMMNSKEVEKKIIVEDSVATEEEVLSEPEVTPEGSAGEEEEAPVEGSSSSIQDMRPPAPVELERKKVGSKRKSTTKKEPPAPAPAPVEKKVVVKPKRKSQTNEPTSLDVELEKEASKPQPVAYSKDQLKSTKKDVDGPAASDKIQTHTPDYVNHGKQLKATGYGDKLKQGEAVPRDHVPQPEDPNAKLGEMYKSVSMKSTGFGDKLKQGEDVPREKPTTADTVPAAPAYATVNLKKAGNPEGKKKKKADPAPSVLPAVKLNKAEPIAKKKETKPKQKTASKSSPIAWSEASYSAY